MPDDRLIAGRHDQLASVLPELATNSRIPTLLFMLNNPTGSASSDRTPNLDRTLLARALGMMINRQEISGPGGGPVEIDHAIDHSIRTCHLVTFLDRRGRSGHGVKRIWSE